MTNAEEAALERQLRKSISLEQAARNVPAQLRPKGLAAHFGLPEHEIIERMNAMRTNKPKLDEFRTLSLVAAVLLGLAGGLT